TVASIAPVGAGPVMSTSVQFAVTLAEPVTGVDPTDFSLAASGATGTISSVTGSGTSYVVTVTGVSGSGTLRLNLVDDDTIADTASATVAASGLSITGGSSLDLNGGDLVVTYAPAQEASVLSTVTGWITSGLYGGPSGFWDGPGLDSALAAGDAKQLHALGIV